MNYLLSKLNLKNDIVDQIKSFGCFFHQITYVMVNSFHLIGNNSSNFDI